MDRNDYDLRIPPRDRTWYILNPPLARAEVTNFEDRHGITLPHAYRKFVTEVGNGLTGPYSPLTPLKLSVFATELARPSRLVADISADDARDVQPEDDSWSFVDGTIQLSDEEDQSTNRLVVNGSGLGSIWNYHWHTGYRSWGTFSESSLPDLAKLNVTTAAARHDSLFLHSDILENHCLDDFRRCWSNSFGEYPLPSTATRRWNFVDANRRRTILEFHVTQQFDRLDLGTIHSRFKTVFVDLTTGKRKGGGRYVIGQNWTGRHVVTAGWDSGTARLLLHAGSLPMNAFDETTGTALRTRSATVALQP
ncbi:SMI1/KNR4 family protein [Nocardia sp. JMUB6875]|uniref:SMI1/KNR4 family protein n=1 Tax=Nocardia sp. JMUB6875 TaxID=3158170 RepID=UPI0034E8AC96